MKSSALLFPCIGLSPLLVNNWVWFSLPGHCCPTEASLRQFTLSEMVPLSLLQWGCPVFCTKLCSVCLLNRTLPSQILPPILLCPGYILLIFVISLYLLLQGQVTIFLFIFILWHFLPIYEQLPALLISVYLLKFLFSRGILPTVSRVSLSLLWELITLIK